MSTIVVGTDEFATVSLSGPNVEIRGIEFRPGEKSQRGVDSSYPVRIEKCRFVLQKILTDHDYPVIVNKDLRKKWAFLKDDDDELIGLEISTELFQEGTPAILKAMLESRLHAGTASYGDERENEMLRITIAALIESHHQRTGEIIG